MRATIASITAFSLFLSLSYVSALKTTNIRGKPVNPTVSDTILFAADDYITVFLNGVQKFRNTHWTRFTYIGLGNLKPGDVIAFEASDTGGYYGMIAVINTKLRDKPFVTGVDDFFSVNSKNLLPGDKDKWRLPNYAGVCAVGSSWRKAFIRTPGPGWVGGQAYNLPKPSKARYIWSPDAAERDSIFVRFKVGGEQCNVNLKDKAKVTFAADDEIELFVNGFLIDWSINIHKINVQNIDLKNGDVVAVRAKDNGGWFGAIVGIQFQNGYSLPTQINTEWRAIPAFTIQGDANAWMYQTYSDCEWRGGHGIGVTGGGSIPSFPYKETGAQYIWAHGVGERVSIFMRVVVGGRDCSPL